MLIHKFI